MLRIKFIERQESRSLQTAEILNILVIPNALLIVCSPFGKVQVNLHTENSISSTSVVL